MILGNATLRGGQTTLHGFRMWGQMLKFIAMTAAAQVVAVPVWNIGRKLLSPARRRRRVDHLQARLGNSDWVLKRRS